MKVTYFRRPADFRAWLARHHAGEEELWVGFYKKDSGQPSLTWPESVDEALCFGWIDGLRKRIDDASYKIRFTPRRAKSIWSAVNIARVKVLVAKRLMRPAGIAAYERREENRSGIYSYENRPKTLGAEHANVIKKNRTAWTFFQAQPPSYHRAVTWWVVSAKTEATRSRRLEQLIEACAEGRRLR